MVIYEDCYLMVALISGLSFNLGKEPWSRRLWMINGDTFTGGGESANSTVVFRRFGAPRTIFHGAVEAISAFEQIYVKKLMCQYS